MQWCDGGDLRRAIAGGGFGGERRLRDALVRPMLRVLTTLAAQDVVHRDLKPENLFVAGGRVLLGDFGLAVSLKETLPGASSVAAAAADGNSSRGRSKSNRTSTSSGGSSSAANPCSDACSDDGSEDGDGAAAFSTGRSTSFASLAALDVAAPQQHAAGTTAYTAPEVLMAALTHSSVADCTHPKNDVFALGLVALECLTGRHPFVTPDASSGSIVCLALSSQPVPLPQQQGLTPQCLDWLRLCLEKDPAQRPGAEQLLQHAWMDCELPEQPAIDDAGAMAAAARATVSSGGADVCSGKDTAALDLAAAHWQQPAKQHEPRHDHRHHRHHHHDQMGLGGWGLCGGAGSPRIGSPVRAGGVSKPPSDPPSFTAAAGPPAAAGVHSSLGASALLQRAATARGTWEGVVQPPQGAALAGPRQPPGGLGSLRTASARWEQHAQQHSPQQHHRGLQTYSGACWEY